MVGDRTPGDGAIPLEGDGEPPGPDSASARRPGRTQVAR